MKYSVHHHLVSKFIMEIVKSESSPKVISSIGTSLQKKHNRVKSAIPELLLAKSAPKTSTPKNNIEGRNGAQSFRGASKASTILQPPSNMEKSHEERKSIKPSTDKILRKPITHRKRASEIPLLKNDFSKQVKGNAYKEMQTRGSSKVFEAVRHRKIYIKPEDFKAALNELREEFKYISRSIEVNFTSQEPSKISNIIGKIKKKIK